jgi:hypothetical protein
MLHNANSYTMILAPFGRTCSRIHLNPVHPVNPVKKIRQDKEIAFQEHRPFCLFHCKSGKNQKFSRLQPVSCICSPLLRDAPIQMQPPACRPLLPAIPADDLGQDGSRGTGRGQQGGPHRGQQSGRACRSRTNCRRAEHAPRPLRL